MLRPPPTSTLFPYTTLFRSLRTLLGRDVAVRAGEGYTLARHDWSSVPDLPAHGRSEEHTSELQSQFHLVCRLLLEKKKKLKQDEIDANHPLLVSYIYATTKR